MDEHNDITSAGEVAKLSAKELNGILKRHGKSTAGNRRHKIVLVCELLGIKDEPGTFQHVLNDVKNSKHGWTKDLRQCPAITLNAVIDYLLRSHDTVTHTDTGHMETFTVDNMKRYKTLRSYRLYTAGHVHSMTFLPMGDGDRCAVKGRCNPSFDTSGTVYECMVLLNKLSEKPIGSSCTCTAGQGEACTHVAAILFALEDFTSLGHHHLPDDPSTTEILCAWNAPKDSKVIPVPLRDVSFEQTAPVQPVSCRRKKRLHDFNPSAPAKRTVDPNRYATLVQELSFCQPDVPFLTIADSSRWTTNSSREFSSQEFQMLPHTLPHTVAEFDPILVPVATLDVATSEAAPHSTLELAEMFFSNCMSQECPNLLHMLEIAIDTVFVLSTAKQKRIEELTMGQSENPRWHHYRKGVVTGTLVHAVRTRMDTIDKGRADDAHRLVDQCLGNTTAFKGNKDTRYGLSNEATAAESYYRIMCQKHTNFRMTTSGFVLDNDHCFIGASPDRIAYCDCHGSWIVEIKCPATMVKQPSGSFHKLPYIENNLGKLQLKRSHHYFAQVMLYMAVCKKHHVDFVLWSPQETAVIDVDFDVVVWQELLSSTLSFYRRFIIPAMVKNWQLRQE